MTQDSEGEDWETQVMLLFVGTTEANPEDARKGHANRLSEGKNLKFDREKATRRRMGKNSLEKKTSGPRVRGLLPEIFGGVWLPKPWEPYGGVGFCTTPTESDFVTDNLLSRRKIARRRGLSSRNYAFQTPEGWNTEGRYRALGYMRPLAIWAMQWALNPPKIPKQEVKPELEADSLSRQHAGFQTVARFLKLPKEKDARSVFQVLFDYTLLWRKKEEEFHLTSYNQIKKANNIIYWTSEGCSVGKAPPPTTVRRGSSKERFPRKTPLKLVLLQIRTWLYTIKEVYRVLLGSITEKKRPIVQYPLSAPRKAAKPELEMDCRGPCVTAVGPRQKAVADSERLVGRGGVTAVGPR
uniref:Uncharacterized protein LOC104218357 n=1 Tax=Nicotiana sylvestris TaxID=4096 RepID=A0A1U7VYQ2_NICSY|nr:PREDICTED: uncharacterized protein LOC104218357 [Nicotiana sylvestris]